MLFQTTLRGRVLTKLSLFAGEVQRKKERKKEKKKKKVRKKERKVTFSTDRGLVIRALYVITGRCQAGGRSQLCLIRTKGGEGG